MWKEIRTAGKKNENEERKLK